MKDDTGSGVGVGTRERRGTNNPKARKVSKDGGAPVKEGEEMVVGRRNGSREQKQCDPVPNRQGGGWGDHWGVGRTYRARVWAEFSGREGESGAAGFPLWAATASLVQQPGLCWRAAVTGAGPAAALCTQIGRRARRTRAGLLGKHLPPYIPHGSFPSTEGTQQARGALGRVHTPRWPTTSRSVRANLTWIWTMKASSGASLPPGLPSLCCFFWGGGGSFQKANVIIPPSVKIPPWLPITLLAPSTCLLLPSGPG